MLAPGLATMLVVITTDADLPPTNSIAALRAATRVSFDRLDSDGCMSTNDQVTLLASGASGRRPRPRRVHRRRSPRPASTSRCSCRRTPKARATTSTIEVRRRGDRRRRRRGRPLGRPQQPVQGRDLRQRPQLGPGARRHRHDEGAVRPVPRRRLDERRPGLPRGRARPPRASDVDLAAAARAPAHRPARRPRRAASILPTISRTTTCTRTARTLHEHGDPLEDSTTGMQSATAATRPQALIESLPWLKRFAGQIIVVKFGGNAMVDAELQRAFAEDMVYLRYVGHQAGRRARRRTADLGDARAARHPERVPRRLPGDDPRGDGGRADGALRRR